MMIIAIAGLLYVGNMAAQDGENTEVVNVPTIRCSSCVKTVTTAVRQLDGVHDVNVNRKTRTATVRFDSRKLTLSDIEKAIVQSGYDANKLKRDPDAHSKLDACCQ